MGAVLHILAARSLTDGPRGATLRNIVLFQGALREIRLTAPAYVRQTYVLTELARFDRVQAFLLIVRLICAHVALETKTWLNENPEKLLKVSKEIVIRLGQCFRLIEIH